ncbi:hypothetical protein BH23ACT12_BH23ACT12_23970 [soil metagenome]
MSLTVAAASGGLIALVEQGDEIMIDIPNRSIILNVSEEIVGERRILQEKRTRPTPRSTASARSRRP